MSEKRKSSLSPSTDATKILKVSCEPLVVNKKITSNVCINRLADAWKGDRDSARGNTMTDGREIVILKRL